MRTLTPVLIATSVAIALAGATTAQAQTNSAARGTAPSATTTTTPSGSTNSLGASGSAGTTAGRSISGTSSGDAFSGSSRGNVPPVGPASARTNGLDRNATGAIFDANGERIGPAVVNPDQPASGAVTANSADNAMANANAATSDNGRVGETPTPELDEAARREVQRARRTVERKGQMMQSITPRTNVDRTDQMPDDSSPLLSPNRR
jgi:hypothetical protein